MRIVLLTEIPAPFRIPIWNALSSRDGIELEVVFLGLRQPNRPYRLHEDEWRFAWRVLPGLSGSPKGRWTAVSVGVVGAVRAADVVVVGGWNQPAFWQAAASARLLRKPLALWVESTASDARSRSRAGQAAKRWLVRAADAVIVPGRASASYVEALGGRRVAIAPNAVDLSIFRDRVDRERARRDELRSELAIEGCCFLAVGRLAPEKGFDVLLRALPAVEGATAVVLGTGPEERRLRELASPAARLVGQVERDELPRWYAAADALVAPSRSEPWGFAIQEAAAAGLPVVASEAAGAAWDLVEEGASGFLVPPDDAPALATAMRRIAADASFRTAAGARSRELAARMTAEAWADAVATAASALLDGRAERS